MTDMPDRRILELFSGIGGMHSAFELSGLSGTVLAAIDINTVANAVYTHNHPDTKLLTSNIQKVTPAFVQKLGANTILMSPPCQPFTRTGKQQDVADARTDALVHLCGIIEEMKEVDAILMENVKGFETSQARDMYVKALKAAGYYYQEFILSPSQLGIPNTRYRYYCLARKSSEFSCKADGILEDFPSVSSYEHVPEYGRLVKDYLDPNIIEECKDYLLPDTLLEKRVKVLDIARPDSDRTMCFTKAYTHYTEGTGSVFCPKSKERLDEVLLRTRELEVPSESLEDLRSLKMRYFTPDEVARFMCFPLTPIDAVDDQTEVSRFSFPKVTTKRQKYRLLGNSINVYVVSVLIRILFEK